MSTSALIQIISIVVMILLSAMFSSSETALTTISRFKIRQLTDDNVKNASIVKKISEMPDRMISSILVGNNVVNICASTIATVFFTNLFGASGAFVATVVMTLSILIFGEVTPKSLAQKNNEKVALRLAKFIYFVMWILRPVIFLLNLVTGTLSRLLGGEQEDKPVITEDELKTIVDVSEEQGVLKDEETEFINNVLDIKENQAVDIMTPRTSMETIDVKTPAEDLPEILKEISYSRIPVYENNIDNIIGILHVKDLVVPYISQEKIILRDLIREPFFAYEYASVIDLFRQMRANNISISIIIDEYGGTSGLITIEDIVEEVVGEIDDEYDTESEFFKLSDTEYIIDAELRIDDVNDYFDIELTSENYDSIGGFVIELLDRLPELGDTVTYCNMQFTIEKLDRRKIESLRVKFL